MEQHKLFMILIGCKPTGRNTEQHDIFFGIGNSMKDIIPQIENFWPDAGKMHIDGWREVTRVDNYSIKIISHTAEQASSPAKLFFLNLGGYKENEFEEFHYKMLTVSPDKGEAIKKAKQTAFYKHTGFAGGAESHIDDKYGVDVDDIYEIEDILPASLKSQYNIQLTEITDVKQPCDKLQLGYFKLNSFQ